MKKQILILWLLPAFLYLYSGIGDYFHYTQSDEIFLIVLPESLLIHQIIMGILSLFISILLFFESKKAYMYVYSFAGWIIWLTVMHFLYELYTNLNYTGWGDCIPDYLMFIPIFFTIRTLRSAQLIPENRNATSYFKKQIFMIFIQSVLIFLLTIFLAKQFPYSAFRTNQDSTMYFKLKL